jgi:putative membrane protein
MFDHGSWMFGGWLTMLLIWLAPFLLLFFGFRNYFGNRSPTARELLDQAYARGELSRDEYLTKRDDLAGR